jgi:hypothetical protein
MGLKSNVDTVLVKLERKRPLGSTRHRWENNIKMDLRVIGMGGRAGFIRL